MEPSKVSALLLIFMLFISSAAPILGCGSCEGPKRGKKPTPKRPKTKPKPAGPVKRPPLVPKRPPLVPKLPPAVPQLPPVVLPPVVPKLPPAVPQLPPVVLPPPAVPTNPPATNCPPPPTPAGQATCPVDSLKLGACVDLLGGLVHIGLGDPVVNQCCPVLKGLVELEAAVCLCTTLKLKLLNLNIYLPLALQLLITCGKTPPPGYTCTL